jgi:SMC interacting uncharacterized protein involved in chromosome segregation
VNNFIQAAGEAVTEGRELFFTLIGIVVGALASIIKAIYDGYNSRQMTDAQIGQIQDTVEEQLWIRVKKELQDSYATADQLREALGERDRRIRELERKLFEKTQQIELLQKTIAQLHTGYMGEITGMQELITRMESQIQILEKERDELKRKIQERGE